MKTEDPSGCQAVPAFFIVLVYEFLKAIGYCERIGRSRATANGFTGRIVEIDNAWLLH